MSTFFGCYAQIPRFNRFNSHVDLQIPWSCLDFEVQRLRRSLLNLFHAGFILDPCLASSIRMLPIIFFKHVRANPDVRPCWHSLDLNTWWMLRNCWGGVGWGRDDDILWTWTHVGCYATAGVGWGGVGWGWWHSLNLNTWWMLRNCWGGVGWGGLGMMTFFELEHMVDATHTWWMLRNCWGGVGWGGVGMMTFFELEHMVDATQLLGWGGVGWGWWTHGGCYAHMVDATQLLGWGGVGWAGDDDILWTWTHGGCCATAGVGWGGVGWGWWHSLNLNTWWMLRTHGGCYAHMVDATQLLGWGRVGWAGDDDILWTWTHGGCYAHMVDATQLLGWGGVGWAGDDDILWPVLGARISKAVSGSMLQWNSHTQPTRCIWLPEARLANRRCRKRIEAWGSRRKDCVIWAVPRKKGSECGTGKGQGCSEHVLSTFFVKIKAISLSSAREREREREKERERERE